MKKIKKIIMLVLLVCVTGLMFMGCTNQGGSENKEASDNNDTITIVDSAGRTVELKKDINKVALMNTGSLEVMRALGVTDKIVSVPSIVAKAKGYYPEEEIQNKPVVSNADGVSYEALIEMNPDIIITYANEKYCDLTELEEKLKSTDIKIVALNFYRPDAVTDEIKIMGKIFSQEEKANSLADLIQTNLDIVKDKVATIKEDDKVSIYYERFMGDYKSVAKGSGYQDLITLAGGENIFENSESPYPTVSAEDILIQNPDVIIKGDNVSKTEEEMKAEIEVLTSRPGWVDLDATKNNKVNVISSCLLTDGIRKPIAVCYFAKALYPEVFKDLDVEAFEKEFFDYQKPGELNVFMYPGK